MTISLSCPSCKRTLQVQNEHAGRTSKCPACKADVTIPTADVPLALGESEPPKLTTQEVVQEPTAIVTELSDTPESTDQGEPPLTAEPASDELHQGIPERPDAQEHPSEGNSLMLEKTQNVAACVLSELKPILETLNEKVETLTREMGFVKQLVDKKEEQFNKLYDENRQYKDDIIGKFRDKIVQIFIGELDSADRQIKTFLEKGESEKTYTSLLASYTELAEDFRAMFANLGITAYKTKAGEQIDPKRHKINRSEAIGEKEKNETIIRTTRYGYERGDGTILRPEFVDMYYYDAKLSIPVEIPQDANEQTNDVVSPVAETAEN